MIKIISLIFILIVFFSCSEDTIEEKKSELLSGNDSIIMVRKNPGVYTVKENVHKSFATFYENTELLFSWERNDSTDHDKKFTVLYKYNNYDYHLVDIENGHWGRYKIFKLEKDEFLELDEYWQPIIPNRKLILNENEDCKFICENETLFTGKRIDNKFVDSIFQIEINQPWFDTIVFPGDSFAPIRIK